MSKFKGYLYGSIAAATYGLVPLFSLPIMAKDVPFDTILCYRFFIASIVIAGVMLYKKISFKVTKKEFTTLSLLGLLFALCAIFLLCSYEYMAAGIATTILFLYPLFVAIIMAVMFKERINKTTWMCMAIAIGGVAMLYIGDGASGTLNTTGIIAIILSGLAYALYIVTVNKSNVQNMGGLKLTFYSMSIASLLFCIKALLGEGLQPLPDSEAYINMVLLGIIPTVISCVTLVYAVQYIGSTYTALLGALDPVTAVIVGIIVFSEPFTTNLAIGILMIIGAVTLIILSGSKKSAS
ncbi:MAG: DMT family transporter [Bacteroidales bacterium]